MYCFVLHIGLQLNCTNSKGTRKPCVCFQHANTRSGRIYNFYNCQKEHVLAFYKIIWHIILYPFFCSSLHINKPMCLHRFTYRGRIHYMHVWIFTLYSVYVLNKAIDHNTLDLWMEHTSNTETKCYKYYVNSQYFLIYPRNWHEKKLKRYFCFTKHNRFRFKRTVIAPT